MLDSKSLQLAVQIGQYFYGQKQTDQAPFLHLIEKFLSYLCFDNSVNLDAQILCDLPPLYPEASLLKQLATRLNDYQKQILLHFFDQASQRNADTPLAELLHLQQIYLMVLEPVEAA